MLKTGYILGLVALLLSFSLVLPRRAIAEEGHSGHNHGHVHSSWPTPPAHYQAQRGTLWNSPHARTQGALLYQKNCVACHGEDGRGTGPLAASLAHPPADLTHHFHPKPGANDAYLFWRVREGGTVEPFKSMGSAMPAFQETLTEEQCWMVLAYVHQRFHSVAPTP